MQKYDTHSSCGNIYFGKNYPYFGSYGSLFGLLPYLLIGGSMSLPKREREGNHHGPSLYTDECYRALRPWMHRIYYVRTYLKNNNSLYLGKIHIWSSTISSNLSM